MVVIATWLLLALLVVETCVDAQRFSFNYNVHPRQRQPPNVAAPIVNLGYAKYRGVRLDAGVDKYLGMRFAQAPLDELRFRAPREPLSESVVQDASQFGPRCIGVAETVPSDGSLSEDCLTANVFTPSTTNRSALLPVWLFIQGGGYATLGPFFNGTEVVRMSGGNILFVNFNYRVGALGFLAGEKVKDDGNLNVGLLDQRMMLEWVQTHISKFGGDPARVTIHGPSAGAGSVAHLLTAYDGAGRSLFAGAIVQSSFWPTQRTISQSDTQFATFAAAVGCSKHATMTCLRNAALADIQRANVVRTGPSGLPVNFDWLPVSEGAGGLVPRLLSESFRTGRFVRVPVMLGNDNDEGTVFVSNAASAAEVSSFLENNYPGLTAANLSTINKAYPPTAFPPLATRPEYFPSLAAAFGEATFTCPGNVIAEEMAGYVSSEQVWNYRVNIQDSMNTAAGLGVPHVFETVAVFGRGNTGEYNQSWNTTNEAMIPVIMNYYISFVRALNPNTYRSTEAPRWDSWGELGSGRGRRLRWQTNETGMEEVPGAQTARCALWTALSDFTEQ